MTPDREALDRGRVFEREAVEALGLTETIASGNQWHDQSDGKGRGIRLSAKSTSKRSWAETRAQLREAIDMAQGSGEVPLLAIEDPVDGERLLLMRLSDGVQLLTDDARPERRPRRSEIVRDTSRVPVLLRDLED